MAVGDGLSGYDVNIAVAGIFPGNRAAHVVDLRAQREAAGNGGNPIALASVLPDDVHLRMHDVKAVVPQRTQRWIALRLVDITGVSKLSKLYSVERSSGNRNLAEITDNASTIEEVETEGWLADIIRWRGYGIGEGRNEHAGRTLQAQILRLRRASYE